MKLQTKSVAKALDVTTDWVRKLEVQGKLRAEKTEAGTRLFEASDVARLAKERAANKKKR